MPSWESARPTWVKLRLIHLPVRVARREIMPAAIGVECPEKPVFADRLGWAKKARHRAFLVDQERRIDLAGRIVEGDHKIEIMTQRRDPAVCRAVLEQQHSRQWPACPLLAVRACVNEAKVKHLDETGFRIGGQTPLGHGGE